MLSIVILICAADIDRSDCTPRSALVVTGAPATASPAGCGLDAQSMIASSLRLEHGEYVKILCRRVGGNLKIDEARLTADGPAAP